jgi:hypothetical protein
MSAIIPSWAVRGAKCVFVGGHFDPVENNITDPAGLIEYPVANEVYTIREIRVRLVPEWHDKVVVGILLHEIVNPIATAGSGAGGEMAFWIGAFRPLASIASDVEAHFAHLLDAPLRLTEEA